MKYRIRRRLDKKSLLSLPLRLNKYLYDVLRDGSVIKTFDSEDKAQEFINKIK